MRIIARHTLAKFWKSHPEAEQPLKAWFQIAKAANWMNTAQVKRTFNKASVINRERVVFDICGGNYRLIVAFKFSARIAWIKFIGTHAEYDRVDATTVSRY
jgi:mRNA interferase HigB